MFDFNIFKAKRNKANSDIVLEREPSDAAGVPGMFKKRNKDQLKPRASVVDNPSS